MKGNKFLAAALAASMVFSTVPATALSVFADSVSVEASDAKITAAMLTLKQGSTTIADSTTTPTDAAQLALWNALKSSTDLKDLDNTSWTNDTVKAAVEKLNISNYTITNVTVTGAAANSASATVAFDYSDNKSYTLEISVVTTADLTTYASAVGKTEGQDLADAIDDYYSSNEFKTYAGETLNSATVLNAYKNASSSSTNKTEKALAEKKTAAADLASVTPTISNFSVSGDDFTATLSWKTSTVIYTYTFTGTVAASTDSKTAVVDAAVKALQATEIPDADALETSPDGTKTKAYIQSALATALKDNGIAPAVSIVQDHSSKNLYTAAKHGTTGSLTVFISDSSYAASPITFTLKESSAQKLAEAKNELIKTSNLGTAGVDVVVAKDDGATDWNTTDGKLYTIASTKKFSRDLQARTATSAVDADTVKSAVEKLVSDAVATFGDDGVTYSTELVDKKYKVGAGSATDPVTLATINNEGSYLVKVTASIANDFYVKGSADAATKDKTSKNVYYVLVKTNTLKEVETTGITLSDQTVALNKTKDFADPTKETGTDAMIIDITPTLTPEGANGEITWTVESAVKPDGKTKLTQNTDYKIVADADGHVAGVQTLGSTALKLVVKQAGTYKIKATYDDIEATATITVTKSFDDVKASAYYADPVAWGYANEIVNGKGNNTFGVGQNVTRAEFVTFLYRIAVAQDAKVAIADDDVKVNDTFSDVGNTAYYAKAVQWAAANNITVGKGDKKFDPNGIVTRAEAVTFIYRAKGQPDTGAVGSRDDSTAQFTDVADNAYYRAAVTWGVNTANMGGTSLVGDAWTDTASHVVSGTSTTTFNPTGATTREQAISFIARAFHGTL